MQRLSATCAVLMAIGTMYVLGYGATFWLQGRGVIGVYNAIRIEGTVYWPLQQYRFSPLPGAGQMRAVREWSLDAGLGELRSAL